jgi:uncharacterized membrane protein YsdA (DUF1294 family)
MGKTMDMIILYLFVIVYILAINVYAFLLIKTLAKQERDAEAQALAVPAVVRPATDKETGETAKQSEARSAELSAKATDTKSIDSKPTDSKPTAEKTQKYISKLCITGALGGAIAIYACMFIFKFKRNDLFLMVIMPLLGVLNIYIWVLLFRSGFRFLMIR